MQGGVGLRSGRWQSEQHFLRFIADQSMYICLLSGVAACPLNPRKKDMLHKIRCDDAQQTRRHGKMRRGHEPLKTHMKPPPPPPQVTRALPSRHHVHCPGAATSSDRCRRLLQLRPGDPGGDLPLAGYGACNAASRRFASASCARMSANSLSRSVNCCLTTSRCWRMCINFSSCSTSMISGAILGGSGRGEGSVGTPPPPLATTHPSPGQSAAGQN